MRRPTLEDVLAAHERGIKQFGGDPTIRDLGLVKSALAAAFQSAGGEDAHLTLFAKAAALGFSLSQNQGFIDGNKRVGMAIMATFLRWNDYEIDLDPWQEANDMFTGIAEHKYSREDLELWIVERVSRKPSFGEHDEITIRPDAPDDDEG